MVHHLGVSLERFSFEPGELVFLVGGNGSGIALNSAHTSIRNSYIGGIRLAGQETQGIAGWNGPGPFTIFAPTNDAFEAIPDTVFNALLAELTAEQQKDSASFGMWLFLASDSLTFGALLFAYSYNRIANPAWPTPFHKESIANATVMTACLLSSSLTMVLGVLAARRGDRAVPRPDRPGSSRSPRSRRSRCRPRRPRPRPRPHRRPGLSRRFDDRLS